MIHQPHNIELVKPEEACPRCGERHVNRLVWIEDGERVRCATCLNIYVPPHTSREGGVGHDRQA